ncbi:glycosyltransferase [Wohlfahrtiimonas chitiniclastica]|uniref:glycosyltransferase n=1 Tax=Wohlfahrtiimonas chitiniclastica TaxID=400946 RepID=UPI001BCB44A4|nr:glycosyltransferase [Wohlfahrtiimonas chitiniclastica]MBS7834582.1 glycosyltransferase [Wohlfahrtiimonas chitiniclastica]
MTSIAIINRSFWPQSDAIGEALLLLAELLAQNNYKVQIITQLSKTDKKELTNRIKSSQKNITLFRLPAITTSASRIIFRILELILFSLYVVVLLFWKRPSKVYVATNPPIVIPYIVRLYCFLFQKKYVYHLQDIHPEAAQVITGKTHYVYSALKNIDIKTIIKADKIITLTSQMKHYIRKRTDDQISECNIILLNNPSVVSPTIPHTNTFEKNIIFCGNAGRLQRIPLLLNSIQKYIQAGGKLPFIFAGGGIFSKKIEELAMQYNQITYLGILSGTDAAKIMDKSLYGLMPIEDEVTNFAFPSKSSSYIYSKCPIIAICSKDTSVAEFVLENNLGYVVEPEMDKIVSLFFELENKNDAKLQVKESFLMTLTPLHHAQQLMKIILDL